MADRLARITDSMREEFLDLSQTLISLYFYCPDLAIKIVDAIKIDNIRKVLDDGIHKDFVKKIGIRSFIGAVDYVKSNGALLPRDIHLNTLIQSLEKEGS